LFGMLWTWWGVETAVVVFLVALAVVVVFAAIVLLRGERPEAPVA
jgi:ABC-type multidrug transport system permease subunit